MIVNIDMEDKLELIKVKAILKVCVAHPDTEGWAGTKEELEGMVTVLNKIIFGEEEIPEDTEFSEPFPSLSEEPI